MLSVQDISLTIGKSQILHDICFTAAAGEITAIVGHNGSGKTTLLRAMTGDLPYDGQVSLNGRDLAHMPLWEQAKFRGVLAQSTPMAFPFTVLETVRIGLQDGIGSDQAQRPQQALARVGLSGFENRFYQELSGGEQQRAQLARVLCQIWEPVTDGHPRWLFLDEPVASLDIGHQLQVMEIAKDFALAGGGVIAVMHDLNLTALFAQNVVLMKNGRVHAAGPVSDVYTSETLSDAYSVPIDFDRLEHWRGPIVHPVMSL